MYSYYITPQEYEIAAQNGIQKRTLEIRIRNLGWNKQKAISQTPKSRRSLGNWPKIAEQNGIPYTTFRARIYNMGWSLEKAANYPYQDKVTLFKKMYELRRIIPKELSERAKANGINHDTLYQRINRGWDPKRAATQPVVKRGVKS